MSAYLHDLPADIRARAAAVRLLALDVDGTLTAGGIAYLADGTEFKSFDVRDGLGLALLRDAGLSIALITARRSAVVDLRARELGIAHVLQGAREKDHALRELCRTLGLEPSHAAFIGDDLLDLPALRLAGLSVAPADAHPWVRERVHWVTAARAGAGAVRELCDALLLSQGRVPALLDRGTDA